MKTLKNTSPFILLLLPFVAMMILSFSINFSGKNEGLVKKTELKKELAVLNHTAL